MKAHISCSESQERISLGDKIGNSELINNTYSTTPSDLPRQHSTWWHELGKAGAVAVTEGKMEQWHTPHAAPAAPLQGPKSTQQQNQPCRILLASYWWHRRSCKKHKLKHSLRSKYVCNCGGQPNPPSYSPATGKHGLQTCHVGGESHSSISIHCWTSQTRNSIQPPAFQHGSSILAHKH